MGFLEVSKEFLKKSYHAERAALALLENFPLSMRYKILCGSAFFRWASFLKESEYWDENALYTFQFEQAKDLLIHARNNIAYYRQLFSDVGFRPEKMQSLEDVTSLPILTKEIVRDNPAGFVDERIGLHSLRKKLTSGSTGIPLTIYENREADAAFHAFRADLLGRMGYSLKSREVILWAFIAAGNRKSLPFLRFGNKLIFSIRHMTGEWLFRYVKMLREFNPEYISGYPSALSVVASFMRKNGLTPGKKLKTVITYSETFYEWQRELIEGAFGTRVFSMYSMLEDAVLGGDCEYSSDLHIYPQYGLTELHDSIEGHREIVATGFTNYAMPLIRYKTFDLVTGYSESCPKCGRNHKTFRAIEGRVQDFLIGKDGHVIARLMPWIKALPHVLQFQFMQEEMGRAWLKIVRGNAYTNEDTAHIEEKLTEMLGLMSDRIDIEIVFVDRIQPAASGKVKMVDQKLEMKDFL